MFGLDATTYMVVKARMCGGGACPKKNFRLDYPG